MPGPLIQGYSGSVPCKCGICIESECQDCYLFGTTPKDLCPNSGIRFLGYKSEENMAVASGETVNKQRQVNCRVGLTQKDVQIGSVIVLVAVKQTPQS